MKRPVVTLLKVGLIAALLTFVFTRIQWHDTLTTTPAGGGEAVVVEGNIESPWDAESVQWRDEGTGQISQVTIGIQADGSERYAVPGMVTYWRQMDLAYFLLGALCYFLCVTFSAVRWWWLLRVNGLGIRWMEAQRFTWIGIFFNNVVPGQTGGDLIKALYIMKRCPGERLPALVSVVVDRIIGLASLALLGALVVLFAFDRFWVLALGIWAVLLLVVLLGVVAFSRRIRRAVYLKHLLEKLPARLRSSLERIDQAVHFYRAHSKGIFAWLVLGMGNHVVAVLSVVLIGKALGVGLPTGEYFVLVPVINIVSALPLGPNGWGVGEALYGQLFAEYGAVYAIGVPDPSRARVMFSRGVALSVLYRLHLTLWSLLGGILVLFEKDRVTRAEVANEVALEAQESADADN